MATSNLAECNSSSPIAERVKTSLNRLGNRQLGSLSCEQQDSTVILTGELGSFYDSQMAQVIAAKVPGVGRVINRVVVCTS